MHTQEHYRQAADVIRQRTSLRPKIGLVLGSGLGRLVDDLTERAVIPYSDIPGWPAATVVGHQGNLVIGRMEGQTVAAQQGRAHYYEGYSLQEVIFPIRVMRALGIETVILTNAAGGVNPDYRTGDLMLIEDHINLPGLVGANPLMGPNDEQLGERFVGMAQTYDRELRRLALRAARQNGIHLRSGVYCAVSGPSFETPAEIRMIRILGGDAVGMSTVHEALAARHGGMRILAFSGITDEGIDAVDTDMEISHEEVLQAGQVIAPRLGAILRGVLKNFPA